MASDDQSPKLPLLLDTRLLKPGLRLAVGVSGGADSVALLCALAARGGELGLVLHVAHLHHGLRGAEADGDLKFVRALAEKLGVPFHSARVDVATAAKAGGESGKARESIEEAARRLRYGWFRQLLTAGEVDAMATAHTRDDQAETVLAKFLRGAWTEGLSGIHPVVAFPEGRILRPLLQASRSEVEAYLGSLKQDWRQDSSNADLVYTRNRVRHELLPLLESWNPQLREHLSQMAELARDEEACWQAQIERLAPQLILPGSPVRDGGRAGHAGFALDVTRFSAQPLALQRRILRHAAEQLGVSLGFVATETLRDLALNGRAGQKSDLSQGLRAERTHRELRLTLAPVGSGGSKEDATVAPEYEFAIPGEIEAPAYGVRLRVEVDQTVSGKPPKTTRLRNWKAGDRVTLRYSSGPRKVKEVLERLRITGTKRTLWPVLEVEGRIVWMRGAELEPESGLRVMATEL
jgi:tRNA(Ile)-lysidine synthase